MWCKLHLNTMHNLTVTPGLEIIKMLKYCSHVILALHWFRYGFLQISHMYVLDLICIFLWKSVCSWKRTTYLVEILKKSSCFVGFIRKWSKVEFIFLHKHTLMRTFTQASFLEPSAVTGWPCSISFGLNMVNDAELLPAFAGDF